MTFHEIERGIKALSKFQLVVNRFSIALEKNHDDLPYLEFNRTSYPGFEAHLFTIADAALWTPELSETDDVIIKGPKNVSDLSESWRKLLAITLDVMNSLKNYRQGLKQGLFPNTHWIHQEIKWYRKNWEESPHKIKPTDEFLYTVDESIKFHIKELNELGFPTTQSCSGLARDHVGRDPYQPYVMFDERMFPRSSAHLFTLADITGWIASYGPHNFDSEFTLLDSKKSELFWDNLVKSARRLAELLHDYRERNK